MNVSNTVRSAALFLVIGVVALPERLSRAEAEPIPAAEAAPLTREPKIESAVDRRRRFQSQELITAAPNTWIFNAGDPPRIVWRDIEEVRRLGFDGPLRVRWFNAKLEEHPVP